MTGLWAFTPDSSSYSTVGGTATASMQLNRCITDNGRTNIGGGMMRFTADDHLGPWTLSYDEVFYVLAGELRIETGESTIVLQAGDIGLIESGTEVTYRGTAGTKAFYTVTPRDWEDTAAPLELSDEQ